MVIVCWTYRHSTKPKATRLAKIMLRRDISFLEDRGPESVAELGEWNQQFAEFLHRNQPYAEKFMCNIKRGFLVSSDFSGFDAPRECFRIMAPALAQVTKPPYVPAVRFRSILRFRQRSEALSPLAKPFVWFCIFWHFVRQCVSSLHFCFGLVLLFSCFFQKFLNLEQAQKRNIR